jgi:origin recognition complex subunit 5
MNILSTAT